MDILFILFVLVVLCVAMMIVTKNENDREMMNSVYCIVMRDSMSQRHQNMVTLMPV